MSFTALQMVNELLSRFNLKEVATLGQTAESTTALRKLNLIQQIISTAHPFVWAEKNTPGTLAAVDGTNIYALATDVAHLIVAKHTYQGGGSIKVIDRATLEKYRADRSQSTDRNTPKFMTTAGVLQASASNTPALRAEFWPVPGADFDGESITYFYTFKLADLAADTDISLIPGDFHWLLIEGAETLYRRGPIRVGGDGAQSQIDLYTIADNKFREGLARLISRDSAVGSSEMAWENEDPEI